MELGGCLWGKLGVCGGRGGEMVLGGEGVRGWVVREGGGGWENAAVRCVGMDAGGSKGERPCEGCWYGCSREGGGSAR